MNWRRAGSLVVALAAGWLVPGMAQGIGPPAELIASVQSGDDMKINLTWGQVGGASGYYVYRIRNSPIQTNATASGLAGAWTGPGKAADNDYYASALVANPNPTTNFVALRLTFPQSRYIGAAGWLPGPHDASAWHWTSQYSLTVGTNQIALYKNIPFNQSGMISEEFRPIFTNMVDAWFGGTWGDPDGGIAELDVWEYERVADVTSGSTTNWQDTGRTVGKSSAYYVTAYDGGGESATMSPKASLRAGDRDDVNSSDSFADDSGANRTGYTRGGFEAYAAQGNPPSSPANVTMGSGGVVQWNASPTETGTGDVKRYRIFRAASNALPEQIQTQALPANGGNGVLSKWDILSAGLGSPVRAIRAIDGDTNTVAQFGAANYSEEDFGIDFGGGRFFAMTGMRVYQNGPAGGANPQWHFRSAFFECSGLRWPSSGKVYFNKGQGLASTDPYVYWGFNTSDAMGWAEFNFNNKGATTTNWMVGDKLIIHMEDGENQPGSRELVIYGVAVTNVGNVTATGAGNYGFNDSNAKVTTMYTYFVLAEDFADQFSMPGKVTGIISARGTVILIR